MASESLIVNVTITKSTRVVSQQAFGVPAVFGPSARIESPQAFSSYNACLQVNGGPYLPSDPEAIEIQALFGQAIKPSKVIAAPSSAAVAQIDTIQVGSLVPSHQYKFTMNDIIISYTSMASGDTQQSILAALLAAVATAFPTNPPITGAVTGSGSGATLTTTSTTPGLGVSFASVDSDLVHANSTANHSIADDIAVAQAAVLQANQFYGVIICSHVASDILQVAAYIETQLLVFVASTADADCLTNVTTDVGSVMKGLTYDRTMLFYSSQAATNGPAGAWMGYMLPTTPGVGNWAMKTLVGVTPDDQLNDTQIGNLISKNINFYVSEGGNGCTLYGITPAGEYFDVTILLDWISSTMKSGVIAVETDPLNLKIAYTNNGITQLENPVRSTLKQAEKNQGIVPGWDVQAPNANDVPVADRQNRVLNNLTWDAQLAGAINQINIQGFMSS